MDRTSGGVPLLSLDAVVIDTETTGLDPRKARVIELAGRPPVRRKARRRRRVSPIAAAGR